MNKNEDNKDLIASLAKIEVEELSNGEYFQQTYYQKVESVEENHNGNSKSTIKTKNLLMLLMKRVI